MGRVATVLEFLRESVGSVEISKTKGDPGGKNTFDAQHFDGSGADAQPLPGDIMATGDSPGAGAQHITGYADPKGGKALEGERRIYARDPATGEAICEVWLKNTGEVVVEVFAEDQAVEVIAPRVVLTTPDVRLSDAAGREVARVGDLVAVSVPAMTNGGGPVVPVVGTPTLSGGIAAAGQIISGQPKVRA